MASEITHKCPSLTYHENGCMWNCRDDRYVCTESWSQISMCVYMCVFLGGRYAGSLGTDQHHPQHRLRRVRGDSNTHTHIYTYTHRYLYRQLIIICILICLYVSVSVYQVTRALEWLQSEQGARRLAACLVLKVTWHLLLN